MAELLLKLMTIQTVSGFRQYGISGSVAVGASNVTNNLDKNVSAYIGKIHQLQ